MLAAAQPNAPWQFCGTGVGCLPTDWRSVTTAGAHTVVVTTQRPVNPTWFEEDALSLLIPMPKASWDQYGNLNQELTWINSIANKPLNPVYKVIDGPYRLTKSVPDQYWEFSINPRYTGPKKPTVAHILYDYGASDAATFLALKKGIVDVAQIPLAYVKPIQALKHYHIAKAALFAFWYMHPNLHPGALNGEGTLLSQLYIRQALE